MSSQSTAPATAISNALSSVPSQRQYARCHLRVSDEAVCMCRGAGDRGQQRPGAFNHIIDREAVLMQKSVRSEEHTSELQSRENLVCRLLLEKKKKESKEQTC